VSAYGTLLRSDHQPLELTTGMARPYDRRGGAGVTVFTNQAGRFVAEGLAPGTWIIEMATEDRPMFYRIDVPKGTHGILQASYSIRVLRAMSCPRPATFPSAR
jgi:outer membrane usher protein